MLLRFAEKLRLRLRYAGKLACRRIFALRRSRTKVRLYPPMSMKKGPLWGPFFILEAGFEPTTHCLEGNCSIQLSYSSPTLNKVAQI